MSATITYDDGSQSPTVFTISDAWLPGLEMLRQSIRNNDGSVKHASVPLMLLGFLNEQITKPVLQVSPTPAVIAAQHAVLQAQLTLEAAIQEVITGGAITGGE